MMTAKGRQSGLACAVDGTIGDSLADDPHYPSRPAEYATDATDANHQTKHTPNDQPSIPHARVAGDLFFVCTGRTAAPCWRRSCPGERGTIDDGR